MSVEVGRYGRIVLPKQLRKRYDLQEGVRLIITEYKDHIRIIPVKIYDHPTQSLYGSIQPENPIDDPKRYAREYTRNKLIEEYQ